MSNIQRSVIVSPCYAIEDLPKDVGPELTSDFLNAWIIGWDPRLLTGLNILPEWKRSDSGSLDLENALIVVPEMSRDKVDIPQRERLQLGSCLVIDTEQKDLEQLWSQIAQVLQRDGTPLPDVAPNVLQDFYALGYMVLQVQILARKLRYSWNLDWLAFSEQVLAAAKATVDGNAEESERWLQASFDSLSQERDRYCSQQIHLLDMVLMAKTTLGESLASQLQCEHSLNFLANASLLRQLKNESPEHWEKLQQRLRSQTASVVGGLDQPVSMNHATFKGLDRAFTHGRKAYEALGVQPPKVFSQFESGMGSILPDVLLSQGFKGVLLNPWSGGRLPTKDSAKIRWQAQVEATPIDCVIEHVRDSSSPETFLHFASAIAKQLDYHHVPTLILAHWPNASSHFMQLLLTVMKRSPALGVFQSVEKYFSSTNQPYGSETYVFKQFSTPLPPTDAEKLVFHQLQARLLTLRTRTERLLSTAMLWQQAYPNKLPANLLATIYELDCNSQQLGNHSPDLRELEGKIEEQFRCADELQNALTQSIVEVSGLGPKETTEPNGYLVVNTTSHPRRVFLADLPGNVETSSSTRIHAAQHYRGRSHVVVDLPPCGFVKFRAQGIRAGSESKKFAQVQREGVWSKLTGARKYIADSDWTLSNEYMEVQIDPKKGHLRSVFVPSKRGSRISGMPSIVLGPPILNRKWQESDFLLPTKTTLKLAEGSAIRGIIEVDNEFSLPSGRTEKVTTRYTLWRGARWIDLEVEFPAANDEFHCVWRTAWANESALINSWQQGIKGKLPAPLQGTVELIEIDDAENKTYLATHGASVHHKWEQRYLVTQFPVSKPPLSEQSVAEPPDGKRPERVLAKLAIGMDWTRPLETARDLLEPPLFSGIMWEQATSALEVDQGAWLAQANIANVDMLFEQLGPIELPSDDAPSTEGGAVSPVEKSPSEFADAILWAHETRGRRAVSKLSFFKPAAEAWRIGSDNRQWTKLDVEDGKVFLNLRPSEQCRIAIKWS